MKQSTIWMISAFLLIVHLAIQYFFFSTVNVSGETDKYIILVDLFANIAMVIFTVLVIGSLLALIPFKGMSYGEKSTVLIPYLASLLLIVLIANFGYLAYFKKIRNVELRPLHKYEDIKVYPEVDCKQVHDGKFETEKVIIERTGSKQIQTDKKTGEMKEFFVEWKSDCEYLLTSPTDSTSKLKIKITSVNPNNYGCYIISEKYADDYPNYLSVKRIE